MNGLIRKLPVVFLILIILLLIRFLQPDLSVNKDKKMGDDLTGNAREIIGLDLSYLGNSYFGQEVDFVKIDSLLWRINDKTGNLVGYGIFTEPFCKDIIGYAGNTPLLIVLSDSKIIKGVVLLENAESKDFVSRIDLNVWNGMSLSKAASFVPDAVSGATLSSKAIADNVGRVARIAVSADNDSCWDNISVVLILKYIVVISIVFYAILVCFKPSKYAKFRLWLLGASVVFIGLWAGTFLSVSLFHSWLYNGFGDNYLLLFVFLVAVIVPLFFDRQVYCSYICPFGALQELIGRVTGKRKLKITENAVFYFGLVKKAYLVFIIVLAISVLGIDFTNFEPFTIFMFQSVSLIVIVLASLILILSLFVFRPWCRFCCPTGGLLNLLNNKLKWRKK